MNRTRNFLFNAGTTAFYQVCVLVYGFVVPKLMLTYYGSELNGLVTSINQFITYFNLVEAGLAGAAVYALYKPLADQDTAAISGIVAGARKLYLQIGTIFLILVCILAVLFPFLKPVSGLSPAAVGILVLVLGVKGALEFFTLAKYRALLTADQKTYVISNTSSLYSLLSMACVYIMAHAGCNIVLVYSVSLSAVFVRTALLVLYSRKHYSYLDFHAQPNTKALDNRWDVFFLQLLGAVQTGGIVVLITVFFSLTDVSVYSVYNMILGGVGSLVGIFTSGLSASFGDVIARRELSTLRRAYGEFELAYYMLLCVAYAICFATVLPFVSIYTAGISDAEYIVPSLAALMVLNGFLYNLKTPQGMLVISAGHYHETRWQTTTQAVLLILVGMGLMPFFGMNGILLGSCISNLYRCIDLAFYIPTKVTQTTPKKTLLRMLWTCATCAVCCLVCVNIPYQPAGYFQWLILAVLCGMICLVLTLLSALCFERRELAGIFDRIRSLLPIGNRP